MVWKTLEKLFHDENEQTTTSDSTKTIDNIRLSRSQINKMLEKLIPDDSEAVCYTDSKKKSIQVQIVKHENNTYFAKLGCENLSDVADKKLFIKEAVEFALKEKKLPLSFDDIGVGGVFGAPGRLGFFYEATGIKAPCGHALVAFKLPNEHKLHIEDPRSGLFAGESKLQSVVNDQVCAYASTALFYFAYKSVAEYTDIPQNSNKVFEEIHQCPELKKIIRDLEAKVGTSTETKKEIIDGFIVAVSKLENPAESEITYSAHIKP